MGDLEDINSAQPKTPTGFKGRDPQEGNHSSQTVLKTKCQNLSCGAAKPTIKL